jgi:hypothetical protein
MKQAAICLAILAFASGILTAGEGPFFVTYTHQMEEPNSFLQEKIAHFSCIIISSTKRSPPQRVVAEQIRTGVADSKPLGELPAYGGDFHRLIDERAPDIERRRLQSVRS